MKTNYLCKDFRQSLSKSCFRQILRFHFFMVAYFDLFFKTQKKTKSKKHLNEIKF